jgi:SAM-dependent methyltransferase
MGDANFEAYSEYYDLLYADKDYQAEADYVLDTLVQHSVPSGGSMLELGCGTGAHAVFFAEKGWRVHGIDLSRHMLIRAQTRAANSPFSKNLCFEFGDVRTFRTSTQFDCVVSLFHVASYQTSNADLEGMFATAATHLKPGGVFLFDFWYGPAVLWERPSVRVKRYSNDRAAITRIAEPIIEDQSNIVEVNYSINVKQRGNLPVEILEKHRMRYFFLPELYPMLSKYGFHITLPTEWLTGNQVSLKSWGVSIAAVFSRNRP